MTSKDSKAFLGQIAAVGADRAAKSLSKLLRIPVSIAKPASAVLMSLDEVGPYLNAEASGDGLALCLTVLGDLEGKVLITFSSADISRVCRVIPRLPEDAGPEHPMVRSALLEMCNILASSFMSSIAEFTNLDYLACPPEMAIDMLDAIIISVLADQLSTEQVVFIDTELVIEVEPFQGKILYFPARPATENLLSLKGGSL